MNIRPTDYHLPLLAGFTSALYSVSAIAYIGPGAGLGMIGSLIAIAVVALIVVLGLVIYPIRLMRKKRREKAQQSDKA
jgi:Flp pilus assembly protein TadB